MGQINTNNYPAVDSLADADLLIVENAIHGTGTTTSKQLRENAIGTDALRTIAQTVTGAINEIFEMASDVVVGLELGKMTSFSDGVIVTDIDLHRAPVAGDRLLVYFDASVQNPTGLTTYNNGTAVTSNLENVSPLNYNAGWNIVQFMNDGLLYNNVWVRKLNVPLPINTLSGLADTAIASPSDGQLLTYDNDSQKWKNKTYVEANTGFPVTELKKLKVGNVVYDTDGMKNYSVSNVANNNITVSVLNSNQFVQEVIAINTGNHTGSSSAWNLVLTDGMNPVSVALKNADGSPFADDIHENELLFVYVDTAGNIARVLEIHSHDLEILKDAIITEKTASGNPITVTDALPYNAVSLSTEIEAIQDLHGQSAPYVGGAGKNKLPILLSTVKSINTVGTWNGNAYTRDGITFTLKANQDGYVTEINANGTASAETNIRLMNESTEYGTNYIANGLTGGDGQTYLLEFVPSSYTNRTYVTNGDTALRAANVMIIEFTIRNGITMNNVKCYPMLRLNTVSDSSFAPYSNICPISGRTEARVERTGRNLWDEDYAGIAQSIKYTPVYVGDGSFTLRTNAPRWDNSGCAVFLLAGSASSGATNADHGAYNGSPRTQTAVNGYVTVAYRIIGDIDPRNYDTELIKASEIINATIQLGTTVYGAEVNWDTGVATVDRVKVSKTWGQMDNATDLGSGVTRKLCNRGSIGTLLPMSAESISNVCAYIGGAWNDPVIRWFHDETNAFFYLPSDTPSDLVCEWLAPLATPTTIQLTPEQLEMLKGYNRLSSDGGGDITLTYKADRLAAIEAALAQIGA